ncbi:MAG: glycosyltransferase family 39 protein [Anaerolineales bacterium]|nr:glycosyltransferase family 39 protein [Anaerolineales bacterium]
MALETRPAAEATARALVGGLALTLVVAGQFILVLNSSLAGLGWAVSAAGLLLFLLGRLRPAPRWLAAALPAALAPQTLWLPAAFVLSALATGLSLAFQQYDLTNYLPVLLVWAGAAAAYLAAWLPAAPRPNWRAWWAAYGREALVVGALILLGLGLRLYQLGWLPRVINGDEGVLGEAALNTASHPLANPFALFENFGSLYLQAINLCMQLLGQNALGLRLAPAIGGTLAVGTLYLLARWLFGARVATTAAALMAVSHPALHFSRTVAVGYIQGTWLIPLELYCFISGLQKRSAARLALGGLALGLHFSVYLGAQIMAAYFAVYLLVAAFVCRPLLRGAWRLAAVFWGGLVVAVLPEAVYAWRYPEQFLARLNIDGTFQSGWLAEQVATTGRSPALILAERMAHAFLALNGYPANDFYGATIPLLDALTAALFLLGLVYALWRWREPGYLLLNGYFWAATLSVGVFAVPPSADSYRMLITLPAALLLAAVGLEQVLALVTLADAPKRAARVAVSAALLGAIGLLNVRAYFYDFVAQCRYGGDPQTRFASYLGTYLSALDRESDVYLLSNDVFRYGTHSSVDFLSDRLPVTNVPEAADSLTSAPNVVIVAIADRAEELIAWARAHPGGALERQYDCERLMLVAYALPER